MDDRLVVECGDRPFFDHQRKPAKTLTNAIEFCSSYHSESLRTAGFSVLLKRLGLLVNTSVGLDIGGGQQIYSPGFSVIDTNKLQQMSEPASRRLRPFLPLVSAHLSSGRHWQRLVTLVKQRMDAQAENPAGSHRAARASAKPLRLSFCDAAVIATDLPRGSEPA
jgi:hypothetical protein